MSELHLDCETGSEADLKAVGTYAYFDHPSTFIWCVAWAFDNEEPQLWLPGQPVPAEIAMHIIGGGIIKAWNAAFERNALEKILAPQHKWPKTKIEQYRCTMAQALAMSLPGGLNAAAAAIGLDITKDDSGHRLMMQMCKPKKPSKSEPTDHVIWWDDEDRKARLYAYCLQDVRVEQAVDARLIALRPEEEKVYQLDAMINDRGVRVDKALCLAARRVVRDATEEMDKQMALITYKAVRTCSSVRELTAFCAKRGVEVKSLAKDVLADLLIRDDLPSDVRSALEYRQIAGKTSTAKVQALIRRVQEDGRMRGNLQYHGAGTGRWAARGAQLQNLPRIGLISGKKEVWDKNYENMIATLSKGRADLLDKVYGNPLEVVSNCIRGMLISEPGHDLIAADFSNIEGRFIAWLAGQEDKLDAFRAFDAGTGPDIYLIAAAGIFWTSVEKAEPYRQVGKVSELSLGYQGGPMAYAKMGKNYKLNLEEIAPPAWANAPAHHRESAEYGWRKRGKNSGLAEHVWKGVEVIKLAWRSKNDKIAAYWPMLQDAATCAVQNPGTVFEAREVKYLQNGSFLWCKLPSGRLLCYPFARMKWVKEDKNDEESETDKWREVLAYKCVNQYTRRWEDKLFYGGLAAENVTQAGSRDIMVEAMFRTEKAGYKTVLTVHDEIVSEIAEGFGSLEDFSGLMKQLPQWATGMPIEVSGWRGKRYRK